MDANAGRPQTIRHQPSNSSSSAIDLPGTRLGIAFPPSPTLRPLDADTRAYTRRRLSWSNAEGRPEDPKLSDSVSPEEDPFLSSVDHPLQDSIPNPDASSTPLLSTLDTDTADDDQARLIGSARLEADGHWPGDLSADSERSAGFTPRPRRQYTTALPFKRTFTNAFHRASMRVANVRGHRPYVPLGEDGQDSYSGSNLDVIEETTQPDVGERVAYRTSSSIHLRGRTLGILGPTNPLRLRLYKLLIHPYASFRPSFHSLKL